MFTLHDCNHIVVILLYIDDMIITNNGETLLHSTITQLGFEFSMKDLGLLHYFLGIEAYLLSLGLFLCQVKYAYDLLACASMIDCKPLGTP